MNGRVLNFPNQSPFLTLLLALLLAFLIFIPEHEGLLMEGYPFHVGAMLDFLVTFVLLVANWMVFKKRIYRSRFLRKDNPNKILILKMSALFIIQMVVNVILVKWYLNVVWRQSVLSFIMDEFAPSVLLIGSWYVGGYLFLQVPPLAVKELPNVEEVKSPHLKVQLGSQVSYIKTTDISKIQREDQYSTLYLFSGKKYLMETSLDSLLEHLPSSHFFRINRQLILSKKNIQSFKKIENRKLKVVFINHDEKTETAIVSRYKAASLVKWLDGELVLSS
ncbi:MAG: LytTR family DNA-binding domain-containing protein [Saprospiraceae bacterium]